jgi:ketosteroid isomerase-like protein
MSDLRAIADRVEIEALRGEFTDAVMMRDYDRGASLFTPDGVVRMPHVNVELAGREEIRAGGERLQGLWEYFVQTTHPGTIQIEGDTASGRAYIQELGRALDGRSHLNYAVYHDRYQRTGDGWKFTERVYEIRYLDTTPLAGSAPQAARGRPLTRRPGTSLRRKENGEHGITPSPGHPGFRSGAIRDEGTEPGRSSDRPARQCPAPNLRGH